jgi:primosomal protein N' (replication factor Y)
VVTLSGAPEAVQGLLRCAELPPQVEILGPVPHADGVRMLLRTSLEQGDQLAAAVRAGVAVRTARKEPGSVRVQRDPLDLV